MRAPTKTAETHAPYVPPEAPAGLIRRLVAGAKSLLGPAMAQRSVATNTGWLIGENVVRLINGAVITAWLARHLGAGGFGVLNYAIAFSTLALIFTRLDLNSIVVHDVVREERAEGRTLGTAFALSLTTGLLVVPIGVLITGVLEPGDTVLRTMTLILLVAGAFRCLDSTDYAFQARQQVKFPVVARTLGIVVAAGFKVWLIVIGASLPLFATAFAAEIVIGELVLVALYLRRGHRFRAWRIDLTTARELWRKSWPGTLAWLSVVIYMKSDQILLGALSTDAELGVYSAAVKLAEIWYLFPLALTKAIFPVLVGIRRRSMSGYLTGLQTLCDVLFALAVVVAIATSLLARPVVGFVFGSEFAGAAPILAVYVWAGVFIFMRAAMNRWFLTEDLLVHSFLADLSGAVVNVGVNLWVIPRYGGLGAAITSVVSYGVAAYLALFFSKKTRPAAAIMTRSLLLPFRPLRAMVSR